MIVNLYVKYSSGAQCAIAQNIIEMTSIPIDIQSTDALLLPSLWMPGRAAWARGRGITVRIHWAKVVKPRPRPEVYHLIPSHAAFTLVYRSLLFEWLYICHSYTCQNDDLNDAAH